DGNKVAGFPDRFPLWKSSFTVPTLAEEIELIQGLNRTLGYNIGIYPEIKAPWFHRHEGKDISKALLKVLKAYGYDSKDDKAFVQCFDPIELKRINDELMPAMKMDLNLVQLMAYTDWNETMVYQGKDATPYNYDWMFEKDGMAKVAQYADGIGPWKPMLVDDKSTKDKLIILPLMKEAKSAGLVVHPYTFRADEGRIAPYADNFDDMLDVFYNKVKVDGVFTDFPDKAVSFLNRG
ncbi:MAG: glycerophosphodiester phosphodiesterase, partial [Photobacterium halotolerans]